MSNRKKHLLINAIMITICLFVSYTVLYTGGFDMFGLDNNTIAIVVALISVAGSLIAHWFLFKKDSNTMSDIKSDTSAVKPTVIDTNEIVKSIRDITYKEMLPMVKMIEGSERGISTLVDELNYQNRLKSENSRILSDKDFLLNGIDELYKRNAVLELENKDLRIQVKNLGIKVSTLEFQNEDLENEMNSIKNDYANDRSM